MAYQLQITGIVQGVGFRPFVARLAASRGLLGYARNTGGAVEVFLRADARAAEDFAAALRRNAPPAARIKDITVTEVADFEAQEFTVAESAHRDGAKFFPPDLGMCAECEAEVLGAAVSENSQDVFRNGHIARRRGYAFNSCVNCGPRYTIMERFPYDRANTTMRDFPLCEACAEDYVNPCNRRFRAETVCCNGCEEPKLLFRSAAKQQGFYVENADLPVGGASGQHALHMEQTRSSVAETPSQQVLRMAEAALLAGNVIAVKGIGGYHLMCRADASAAIDFIRELKGRDTKPFARMFYDMAEIEKVCAVSKAERELLTSPARPIVLLKPPEGDAGSPRGRMGAFLPYTPLHKLLLGQVRCAVATSLNRGGASIVIDDSEALAFHPKVSVLYHNRPIARRAEDSVVQVINGKPGMMRRARGYVPLPFAYDFGPKPMLALGGDLKAAFGVYKDGCTVVSPYCGDMENPEAFDVYRHTVDDLLALFEVTPQVIIADAHPRYFTHAYAKALAARFSAELRYVYHHHAHIASVMAEHGLNGKVLGVAFDGAGYGTDGAVWGGEFLICEGNACERFAHLDYVNLLGADSAARDAVKTAECYLHYYGLPPLHEQSGIIRAALAGHVNTYKTSSAGRLFDVAAAMLGICAENTYEGECAAALQYAAEDALLLDAAGTARSDAVRVVPSDAAGAVRSDAARAAPPASILALRFHQAIAGYIGDMAEAAGIEAVALSGGVFQNALLAEITTRVLTARGFKVYMNEMYPANDGGLCLGQLFIAQALP